MTDQQQEQARWTMRPCCYERNGDVEDWRIEAGYRTVAQDVEKADAERIVALESDIATLRADLAAALARAEEAEQERDELQLINSFVTAHGPDDMDRLEAKLQAAEAQVRALEQERDQWREALLYMQMPKCAQCALRGSDVNRCQATDCPHAPRNRALSQHPTEGAS